MTKAIIGVYRHDPRANQGEGQSRLSKVIELDSRLDDLIRKSGWKGGVEGRVLDELGDGFEVLSISVAHGHADMAANIIVTVNRKPSGFGKKRKPVTRGGAAVGSGPIKTGKTMAAKRRSDGR